MPILYKLRQLLKNALHLYRYPPGYFYSPLPDLDYLKSDEERVFSSRQKTVAGIDLNESGQLALLAELAPFSKKMPFGRKSEKDGLRFYFGNGFFEEGDASVLFCFLAKFKPKKIVEIGSGFSSALMLDAAGILGLDARFTFVEPYPQRLYGLLEDRDKNGGKVSVLEKPVQQCGLGLFENLQAGDFLFVDSSHVLKTGSDLHYILFDALPALPSGAIVHFHDIFFPFEYPKNWVYGGRAWNEAYALRAFLMHNSDYEILFFNDFMGKSQEKEMREAMPLFHQNFGGGLWLRKK